MSSSDSQQTQQTTQQDNRNVLASGATLAQGGSTINQTTFSTTLDAEVANHAIDDSVADLGKSLDFGRANVRDSFDFAAKSQGMALDSLNTEANLVKDAYADAKGRGALTDKILIGAIAMAGLVAVAALRKK